MTSCCNFVNFVILYLFSAYYLVKEFLSKVLLRRSLSGQWLLKSEGRVAVITGGTSGIGLAVVKKLLSFGMKVIIGSNASDNVKEHCLKQLKGLFPDAYVCIYHVDLSEMASVKLFAEKVLQRHVSLHILINNAGQMFYPYQLTKDGFESHFAVNYLSHCLLTKLLLPRLQESGKNNCHARIINVASCVHYLGKIDFEDIHYKKAYCCHKSYMQSKLSQIMFTQSLDRFLKLGKCPVTVNCLHPGVIYSELYRHVWWAAYLGPYFFDKPERGAEVVVYASLAAKLEHCGGKYIEDFKIIKPSKYSKDMNLQNRLWNETWRCLKPWLDTDVNSDIEDSN